ncbi:DNA polymerase IV [Lapidilactobacillus luobeiensis]|uniref:DNA polymerase IV n=1 Tax=Lapidilactobacillus luobeiensis TaxID=2950371 RepID=UPI0021C293EA|nr:DNA polymerase IV [Lapidilactobacillus luobeiensis]
MGEWLEIPLRYHTQRRIIHLDMDAFYASVEIREQPELKTKAVVVGPDPRQTGGHGVVTTANYVARKFGVHSAMPAAQALKLIPREQLVFVPPHFELYREVSAQIHQLFHQITDVVEPISLDEAFLDVTNNKRHEHNTIKLAQWLQQQILQQTHLTCSMGISYNKFLAKVASDHNKPMGRTIVRPELALAFLGELPIESFFGVGKKMQSSLHELGVYTGHDLQQLSQAELIQRYKKMGFMLYQHARGVDDSPVSNQRDRKSIGKETTFNPALTTDEAARRQLTQLSQQVAAALQKRQLHGKVLVLKLRDADFNTVTKRRSLDRYLYTATEISQEALLLWQQFGDLSRGIRLLGVTITDLFPVAYENLSLPLIF